MAAACAALLVIAHAGAATSAPARQLPAQVLAPAAAQVLAPATAQVQAAERGKRIFHGLDTVPATVQQHGTTLPAHASKCINCHSADTPAGEWTGNPQYLSATTLSLKFARRGGPAYRYDRPTFCNTIRTGVDPAAIVLESKMPRYRMSETQCADLWLYLTGVRPGSDR